MHVRMHARTHARTHLFESYPFRVAFQNSTLFEYYFILVGHRMLNKDKRYSELTKSSVLEHTPAHTWTSGTETLTSLFCAYCDTSLIRC